MIIIITYQIIEKVHLFGKREVKNSRIERWDETTARQASLTNSGLWKSIPAVKENHVYTLDSKFNYDDPITLDRLLDEIVTIMKR